MKKNNLFLILMVFLICIKNAPSQTCGSLNGISLPCWTDFLGGEGPASLPFYPYAKRENGCSIPGATPGSLDNFASLGYDFSFRSACNKHDRCYYTIGTNAFDCNTGLTKNLLAICAEGLFQSLTWSDLVPPIGSLRAAAVKSCEAKAIIVAGAVSGTGFIYYDAAQETQKSYLSMVDGFLGGRVVPAIVNYLQR